MPQIIYKPRSLYNRQNQPGGMKQEIVGGISSKSYSTFPTFSGSCLKAAQEVSNPTSASTLPPTSYGNLYGWDMITIENLNPEFIIEVTTTNNHPGKYFNVNQAKMQYWSNQLCGNPFEWACVTMIMPMIQYRPFVMADVVAGFNHNLWSVYTGEHIIAQPADAFTGFSNRIKADGTALAMNIGEYGDLPCLLAKPKFKDSTLESLAYQGLWWITEGTSLNPGNPPVPGPPTANAPPYRLNARPYGMWYEDTANPRKYQVFDTAKQEILLTNIIFDGQVRNEIWNENAELIKGHDIYPPNIIDSLASQSNAFFDGAYVEWKIGRLNDQMTFPEQYIDYGFEQQKSEQGVKGVAQYLPNTYMTNYMMDFHPEFGANPAAPRNDIKSILTNSSKIAVPAPGSVQGNYNMCPLKMGFYKSNGAYIAAYAPEVYWKDATIPAYNANMYGPPCYSFFETEFTQDIENTTGFKKIADRKIRAYRYLPQTAPVPYTAYNAYHELIHTGLDTTLWTTKPATMSYPNFEKLWNTAALLNDGKGCGWIPIFSKNPAFSVEYNNIPFLGVIYHSREQDQLPVPEAGEFFMMGSTPSLSQNDLHLPNSSQQTHTDEWKPNFVGMCPATPGTDPTGDDIGRMQQDGLTSNWATSKYVGTNDPAWVFDNTYNRYTYSKLHTDYFKGNGQFQYGNTGASTNPDAREVQISGKTASCSRQITLPNGAIGALENLPALVSMKYAELIFGNVIWDACNPGGNGASNTTVGVTNAQYGSPLSCTQFELKYNPVPGVQDSLPAPDFAAGTRGPPQAGKYEDWLIPSSLMPYPYIEAEKIPYPTISAQSGIGIVGIAVPRTDGTQVVLSNSDYSQFKGTLLDKMGFSLNQFLPLFGKVQTQLNHTLFNKYTGPNAPAGYAYHNLCYPVTTQAQISTSLTPALNNGFGVTPENIPITAPVDLAMPFYRLGMLIPNGATIGASESMFAERLPQKLSFPYLVCRSNIQTPTNLQYIGGPNGQQLLPVIGYLMVNYASNDFFYIQRSDLIFTATRPYVITEVQTSIHLPNGQLADNILDENSAVIYRVDFAKDNLTPKQQNEKEDAIQTLLGQNIGKMGEGGEKKKDDK